MTMQTIQVRLTKKQMKDLDKLVDRKMFPNRSYAIRFALIKMITEVCE